MILTMAAAAVAYYPIPPGLRLCTFKLRRVCRQGWWMFTAWRRLRAQVAQHCSDVQGDAPLRLLRWLPSRQRLWRQFGGGNKGDTCEGAAVLCPQLGEAYVLQLE